MKRKLIMQVPATKPKTKAKKKVVVQVEADYLILDLWEAGNWKVRHAMHTETGEYGTWDVHLSKWTGENLNNAFGLSYWHSYPDEKDFTVSPQDKELIISVTEECYYYSQSSVYSRIVRMEENYGRQMRQDKEERRLGRIQKMITSLPQPDAKVYDWIRKNIAGELHYAFYYKDSKSYHCTACGGDFGESAAAIKPKHKVEMECPLCGHKVIVDKRHTAREIETGFFMIHNVDDKKGVERFFNLTISWEKRRSIDLEENICLFMLRNDPKKAFKIYYRHWGSWDRTNPRNRRHKTGYLYPEGIQEGLRGTDYAPWMDVLPQLAAGVQRANYNRLLVEANKHFARTAEYLFKGRFYRLLEEVSGEVSYYFGYGNGLLLVTKETIEEVMQIKDRQKINRLRQENGGMDMLEWLQWSDDTGKKISKEALDWCEKNRITAYMFESSRAESKLSLEQLMNYLNRQKAETIAWKKRSIRAIFETYEDYLSMASRLGKDLTDEMVYRPRELKRRHDELVQESELRAAELAAKRDAERAKEEAERMAKKYPGSEEILEEITGKYAYEDEQYRIVVPKNFFEITMEGMALHHCVGHTERYFDRILQRETYICFLRKQEEPDKPFYTIEVEPGGTIRQHRGYLDEEPDIELVKPFLREWQKVIRKRMSKQDHEYAKVSAVKREQNIEELRQKNNIRVLEGLMEDLMEVI